MFSLVIGTEKQLWIENQRRREKVYESDKKFSITQEQVLTNMNRLELGLRLMVWKDIQETGTHLWSSGILTVKNGRQMESTIGWMTCFLPILIPVKTAVSKQMDKRREDGWRLVHIRASNMTSGNRVLIQRPQWEPSTCSEVLHQRASPTRWIQFSAENIWDSSQLSQALRYWTCYVDSSKRPAFWNTNFPSGKHLNIVHTPGANKDELLKAELKP